MEWPASGARLVGRCSKHLLSALGDERPLGFSINERGLLKKKIKISLTLLTVKHSSKRFVQYVVRFPEQLRV